MSRARWIKDSFIVGLVSGAGSLTFLFYLFSYIRSLLINYTGNYYMLRPPAVQLFAMVINVILFRILMINLDKEKTAKGFLFITVLATLAYFAFYFRVNRS
jgi:hypothetical protein